MTNATSDLKPRISACTAPPLKPVQDFARLAAFAGTGFGSFTNTTGVFVKTITAVSEALSRQIAAAHDAGQVFAVETVRLFEWLFESAAKISEDCWAPPSSDRIGAGRDTAHPAR